MLRVWVRVRVFIFSSLCGPRRRCAPNTLTHRAQAPVYHVRIQRNESVSVCSENAFDHGTSTHIHIQCGEVYRDYRRLHGPNDMGIIQFMLWNAECAYCIRFCVQTIFAFISITSWWSSSSPTSSSSTRLYSTNMQHW